MTTKTTKIDTTNINFEGDIEIERLVFAKSYTNEFMYQWKLGRKSWRGYDAAEERAYYDALDAFDAAFGDYLKTKRAA